MKEIVGAVIFGVGFTNDPKLIIEAVESGTIKEFLDRKRIQFMVDAELGYEWRVLAQGPTFFCIAKDGSIHPPEARKQKGPCSTRGQTPAA